MSAWSKIVMSLPLEERLNPVERKILQMLSGGMLNKEIAPILGYTEQSIDNMRIRLIKKMEARNTANMIAIAYKNGILK